jgi:RHS repeat-associated protein
MRATRTFISLLAIALCSAPLALAQVPDLAVAGTAPIPEAGHHYIGTGVDTVSPADGLLSFNLPVQTPAGRQLSLPFGFRYSSSEPFNLLVDSPGLVKWFLRTDTGLEQGGWSYDLPTLTWGNKVKSFWSTYTGQPPQGRVDHQCDVALNYVFRSVEGAQYQLYLGGQWVDINYTSTNPPTICGTAASGSAVAHGMMATTPTSWTDWTTQPPVTMSDQSGRIYQFPAAGHYGLTPSNASAINALVPASITDRNGNQISLNSGSNGYKDTLGRNVLSWSGFGNNGDQVTISGLAGNIGLHWANVSVTHPGTGHTVHTPFTTSGCSMGHSSSASIKVVTEIDLPNTTKYVFSYDATYGRVSKITFPSGGYVRYVWGLNTSSAAQSFTFTDVNGNLQYCDVVYDTAAVTDRYVSYDGSTEVLHQHFAYSTTWDVTNPQNWDLKATTVTSTDLLTNLVAVTIYDYVPATYGGGGGPYGTQTGSDVALTAPVESSVIYQDGGGHTLKTVNKTWLNTFVMVGEQTVLDNGQGATTLRCYNSDEEATDVYEYGFQGEGAYPGDPSCASSSGLTASARGPLRRHTVTAYHNFTGATPSTHILNEPDSVTVYDGSGIQVQQSTFAYDANSVVGSGAATGLVTPPGLRGNASTVTHWLNTGGSSPVTSYAYFDTGQVQSTTDACGNTSCSDVTGSNHTTTYSYTDSYTSCGGSAPPAGSTNAYLTTITNPLGQAQIYCYGYLDGLMRSSKDPNSQTTSYQYIDSLLRLTQINYPDGGQTNFSYNDTPPSPSVTTTKKMNSTQSLTNSATMDGLGHTVKTLLTSDPDCASGDRTDTTYDGMGRPRTVSNPYCTTSDPTYGLTTYNYDALGRTTQVTHPDNSTLLTTYAGRATQVQDEGNGNGTQRVTRISQTDGLGHLASLCEVAPGPFVGANGASTSSLIGSAGAPVSCGQDIAGTGFLTSYQYDALGNLLQVNQSGIAARAFNYDSLSRLLTASNPESGAISYSYDANGNLFTKTAPAPNQTGTATVTTTFQYDGLNRLTLKSFSDGTTPNASFAYDVANSNFSCGGTPTNAIGRLTGSGVPGWSFCYQYDYMGRLTDKDLHTPQNQWHYLDDAYDLLGNMTTETAGYGSAYYAYNTAGRLTSATSSYSGPQDPANVISGMHYTAFGGLTSATLGDNEAETYSYVPKLTRLQSYTAKLSATTLYNFNIGTFAPNGDIVAANDSVNGNWTYAYDAFNRLTCANLNNGTCASPTNGHGTYNYVYDRFGNRWQQNGGTNSFLATFTGNNPGNPQNNNRMDGYSYDAAGNVLNDGTHGYTFDAENRIISVDNGATATYVYDADGRRVQKTSTTGNNSDPAGTWIFFYDQSGRWVQEFNSPGNTFVRGNIYAGGRHLALVGGGTTFSHSDWLGTERVRNMFSNPTILETCSSLPFGDGLTCTGSDVSPLHFTGKERDAATGLDNFGARYNSSSFGRFMSPDWSASPSPVPYASISYPQSLNLYAYVQNDPLKSTDPTGHCTIDGEKHNFIWCGAHDLGITETKKETAAREKNEAEVREFLRAHPEILRQYQFALVNVATAGALTLGEVGGWGENSTVAPEESAAIETGAAAGTARTMVNGVPQPVAEGEIVVGPNGTAVKIPAGYVAEPAANGNGIVYRPAGTTGNANIIRVSGPDSRNPSGSVRIYNSEGQPIIPSTGKPGSQAQTHTPL